MEWKDEFRYFMETGFLENTPIFVALAILAAGLAAWRVKPNRFRQIPWPYFCLGAALFWGIFATGLVLYAWGRYYSHFAPPVYRLLAPLVSLLIYPLWSLLLRWLALRLPGLPAIIFVLLGGLQGLFEHAIAIYWLDILEVPMLQGSPPLAVCIFAFFEYSVYWGIVLILADTFERCRDRFR